MTSHAGSFEEPPRMTLTSMKEALR
jgi:hypothetical protein